MTRCPSTEVKLLGQEERRLDVQVHHLVPARFWEIGVVRAPGGPGIVDEDIELVFLAGQLGNQFLDAFHGRNVALDRDDPVAQFLGRFMQFAALARRDVDAIDTGGEEAFDDHAADPAAPAGHERDAPLEAE